MNKPLNMEGQNVPFEVFQTAIDNVMKVLGSQSKVMSRYVDAVGIRDEIIGQLQGTLVTQNKRIKALEELNE